MTASNIDPDRFINGLLKDFPHHQPGTRPVHSFGVLARGRFEPNDVGLRVLGGTPLADPAGLPVTVRFSNGRGDRDRPDSKRDVRGMAVRFATDQRPREPLFDVICMTLPVFFTRTAAHFEELMAAAVPPAEPRRTSLWRKVLDAANLRTRDADPMPGDDGVAKLSVAIPEVCPAFVANFNQTAVESFATCRYHAVHALRVAGADGSHLWLRLVWEPVANVRRIDTDAEDFLRNELSTRGQVQFVLRAQVADQGDDLADVSRPWPRARRRLALGLLSLTDLTRDAGEDTEYNPHHLPEGISAHPDDEIFWLRGPVYTRSAERRAAARGATS